MQDRRSAVLPGRVRARGAAATTSPPTSATTAPRGARPTGCGSGARARSPRAAPPASSGKYLACVDRRLGNFSDGRLRMVRPMRSRGRGPRAALAAAALAGCSARLRPAPGASRAAAVQVEQVNGEAPPSAEAAAAGQPRRHRGRLVVQDRGARRCRPPGAFRRHGQALRVEPGRCTTSRPRTRASCGRPQHPPARRQGQGGSPARDGRLRPHPAVGRGRRLPARRPGRLPRVRQRCQR